MGSWLRPSLFEILRTGNYSFGTKRKRMFYKKIKTVFIKTDNSRLRRGLLHLFALFWHQMAKFVSFNFKLERTSYLYKYFKGFYYFMEQTRLNQFSFGSIQYFKKLINELAPILLRTKINQINDWLAKYIIYRNSRSWRVYDLGSVNDPGLKINKNSLQLLMWIKWS